MEIQSSTHFPDSLNILERCKISPPLGSVSQTSLPLTIFDVFYLPFHPFQRVFFFEQHCSENQFTNTILPNVKHSLSLALHQFFPLAGNLTWPPDSSRPEIHYVDGDSVSFIVAESDYDFDVLVRDDEKDVAALYPLVPQLIGLPAEKCLPLAAFQVTLFPGKGISIGIIFNHVAADGRAIHHFIKTWASICQSIQGTSDSTIQDSLLLQQPCISKSLVKEERPTTDSAVSNYLKKTNVTRDTFCSLNHYYYQLAGSGTDKVFATFLMGRAEIRRLKQWILANINKEGSAPPLHLSTFVLTCAYVWVCSIKAQSRESVAEDEMEYFVFPVDCRARLDPPLPVAYFGNCVESALIGAKSSDLLGEQGILIAAELIGNTILGIEDGNAILKRMERLLSDINVPPRLLAIAGSTKFGIYDTDFGWGKPKKSQVISNATSRAIALSDCPSEVGAVEVGLARDKAEMDAFASLYTSTMESFPPFKI